VGYKNLSGGFYAGPTKNSWKSEQSHSCFQECGQKRKKGRSGSRMPRHRVEAGQLMFFEQVIQPGLGDTRQLTGFFPITC